MRQLGWQGTSILAAGRTDTGVHAQGQVIAFDLEWKHPLEELQKAINANLPSDVVVRKIQPVEAGFHPRRDARLRCYRYCLFIQEERDPLRERYAWRVWPATDLTVMRAAALLLTGQHDFSAFGTPPRPESSPVRTVYQAGWREEQFGLVFEVAANAFLYHMVRKMVYLQVVIGQGKEDLSLLSRLLKLHQDVEGSSTLIVQGLAPANGLVLAEVQYLLKI